MGQKVNVLGYRLGQKNQGPNLGWKSIWCKKGKERGITLQLQSLSESFFKEVLNKTGFIPVNFNVNIIQKENKEYWDWTIQILAQPFIQQWRKEKNPFKSKEWYKEYQQWLIQTSKKGSSKDLLSFLKESNQFEQGQVWEDNKKKEEWEVRMEEEWKRSWEKSKEKGNCPSLNGMIKQLLKDVGVPGLHMRVKIEVVDALSSAEAYIKATLNQSFLRGKKKSWRVLFQDIIKERMEENKPYAYRVWSAGRHNGVEMARTEKMQEGRLSFQRLDDAVEYSYATRLTKYGLISFKLWMFPKRMKPVYKYTSSYVKG
jgi:hypothetical protein